MLYMFLSLFEKQFTNRLEIEMLENNFLPAAAGQVLLRRHHLQVTFTNLDPDSPGYPYHPKNPHHTNQ